MSSTESPTYLFDSPFYEAQLLTDQVPEYFTVGIGGRPYIIDTPQFSRQTLPILREGQDTKSTPGEASLSTKGLWMRVQKSWHLGAGQDFFDNEDVDANPFPASYSSRNRYYRSLGLNPWTRFKLSMLNDTEAKAGVTVNAAPILYSIGGYLYLAFGSTLRFTADPTPTTPSWASPTGTTGAITAITSDGINVYVTTIVDTYKATIGGTVFAAVGSTALPADNVLFANGRLLVGQRASLYEVLADGTTTLVKTHRLPGFRWTVLAASPAYIYAGGNAGELGELYSITEDTDTGALKPPTLATSLPIGEKINACLYYVGTITIATSKGLRRANAASTGTLDYGKVVTDPGDVRCLTPDGTGIWFGWSNYDTDHTGTGRVEAGTEVEELVGAFSSAEMGASQGTVHAVARFQGRTYFATPSAIFGETTNKVATAVFDTGWLDFGIPYRKRLVDLDFRTSPLDGTIEVRIVGEDGAEHVYGSNNLAGSIRPSGSFDLQGAIHERFRIRFYFTRSATDTTQGPELVRWMLRVKPSPPTQDEIVVPIIMARSVLIGRDRNQSWPYNPRAEEAYLRELARTRQPVAYQHGNEVEMVTVESVATKPWKTDDVQRPDNPWFDMLLGVTLHTLELE